IASTTPESPPPHVPVFTGEAVAVGNENEGPRPTISLCGAAGVKNVCSWISPTPLELVPFPVGMLSIGTIVRLIKVTFRFRWIGITGWKLRLKNVWSLYAPPPLKLNWNGTETTSPTGFCVVFASSVTEGSAAG